MANTPQDDRFYKSETLLKWFGISSIVMLIFSIWMVLDDFGASWKEYQREFFVLQQKKYNEWIDQAKQKIDEGKLKELTEAIKKADDDLATRKGDLARLEKELVVLRTQDKNSTTRYQDEKAVYDVRKYEYEAKYGHEIAHGHVQEGDAHAKEAAEKLDKDWQKVLQLRNAANEATQIADNKQREIDGLYAEKTKREKELKVLRADLDRLQMAKSNSELTLTKLLRSAPIVDMANPTFRLQQIVLPTIRDDIFFSQVQKVDRCTTCHQAIDKPGFEKEPQPFRTHPRLDLMLGSRSPHPIDKIGCTVCHEGRGSATHFVRSAHTPRNPEQEKEWKKKHGWHEMHHVIEKMVPLQYTEGKCRVCHKQTENVPGAEKLNKANLVMRSAGCYGCHRIEGWDHIRKPAPSLKRMKGKLTRDWVVKWLHNPREFNENTRMPSPFFQSNIVSEEHKQFQEAEIQSITDYLMAESEDYQPFVHGNTGNAEKGKELFGSVGCLGCHQIKDFPRTRMRWDRGPDLSTVGSKVSKDWLLSWLKNPRHYWADTAMPSLRLTDTEIADLAAFLLDHKNPEFDAKAVAASDAETQKKVLRLYLERDPKLAPVTKEKVDKVLSELKPHEVSQQLGKLAMGRYGCYGCHEVKGWEKTPGIGAELSEEGSKPVNKFDFGLTEVERTNHDWFTGKLTNTRMYDKGLVKEYLDLLRMPNFGFTDEERELVVMGLMGMTSQKISPPAAKEMSVRDTQIEEGMRVAHKYNCQGCHIMEGLHHTLAEDDPNREESEKHKYDLEGRILKHYEEDETLGPPVILTEGARIHTDWGFQFLKNPSPWLMRWRLKVRMPSFQMPEEELNKLVTYWAAQGGVPFPIVENAPVQLSAQQMTDAKALFNKLQCMNCHTFGGYEKLSLASVEGGSKGIAPDLRFAAKKLRRDWIIQFLKDPNKMIPGTRMPGFWPEGNSPAPEILGGNSEAQINLIADYVLYLGQGGGRASGNGKVGEATPAGAAEAKLGSAPKRRARASE